LNDPFCSEGDRDAAATAAVKIANAFDWGRKRAKLPPSTWAFVAPPEEDRATAIGNMHKNW